MKDNDWLQVMENFEYKSSPPVAEDLDLVLSIFEPTKKPVKQAVPSSKQSFVSNDDMDEELAFIAKKFGIDTKESLIKLNKEEESKEKTIPISFEQKKSSTELLLVNKVEESIKKMMGMFPIMNMDYRELLNSLILYLKRLDNNIENLCNMSGAAMDKIIFTYLAGTQKSYTNQYCEIYRKIKSEVLNSLDNSMLFDNVYVCNSGYINALTVEYVYEYCINKRQFSDREIEKRIQKDAETLNELYKKNDDRHEKIKNRRIKGLIVLGVAGVTMVSLPLLAASGVLFYLLKKDYSERKKIIELDMKKMRELYPEIESDNKNQGYSR